MVAKEQKKDVWLVPAVLISWVLILLVVWDVSRGLMARRELVRQLGYAVELRRSAPLQAVARANELQLRLLAMQHSRQERFLNLIRIPMPDLGPRFADVYAALGDTFYERNDRILCMRAYSLALCCDPSYSGVAMRLGELCVFNKQYELGYRTVQIGKSENPKMAEGMLRIFTKRLPPEAMQ